jgi:secondary thiamine-phosphate synthase enzyme
MKHYTETITLSTDENLKFIDITDKVRCALAKSGIANGILNVYCNHTTASITINERCERLQADMERLLKKIAPRDGEYQHNIETVDGRLNAHSHLMSLMLNSSESMPVTDGKIRIGEWQSVFFIELDGPRRVREVFISVMGE